MSFKYFKGIIKIPTILGLGILILGLGLGIFLLNQNQNFASKASSSQEPKKIDIANIADTQASIYWETGEPNTGFIKLKDTGGEKIFLDDRDQNSPQPHQLHFVTITNLSPETVYEYKVVSGGKTFENKDYKFKTAPKSTNIVYEPIIGTVVKQDLTPVSESFVFLNIPGAEKIASITKVAGNFIFPLRSLKSQDLSESFSASPNLQAKITTFGPDGTSSADISFPPKNPTIPPLIIGKRLDLLRSKPTTSSASLKSHDLNNDGLINAADISLLLKNFGKVTNNNQKMDYNSDGVINEKDLELLSAGMK